MHIEHNTAANAGANPLLELTGNIVAAYVSRNAVASPDIPGLIKNVHAALRSINTEYHGLYGARARSADCSIEELIKESVGEDYIICLEDGKKLKMLKRYLKTNYNMTPEEYRKKWGLPADYPMVAPGYAVQRSQLAKSIGLGTSRARKKRAAFQEGRQPAHETQAVY